MSSRLRRLILQCVLCAPDGLLIEPTGPDALYAAVDHALDDHRGALLADPHTVLDALSVIA